MLEGIEKADLQARQWKKALGEFEIKMKKIDTPFCRKCAKLTYDKEGMIDKGMVTKLKEVSRRELFNKKTSKLIGEMIDYKCSMGHGVSYERKILEGVARNKKNKI